jgi:hypothetical protein
LLAHGGLTYSEFCQEDDKERGVCHITENDDIAWWFGFDCAHYRDYSPAFEKRMAEVSKTYPHESPSNYKDINYAKEEVKQLAMQLHEQG